MPAFIEFNSIAIPVVFSYTVIAFSITLLVGNLLRKRRLHQQTTSMKKRHVASVDLFEILSNKIDQDFDSYDRRHPEVYNRFCQIVQGLIRKGHRHYSADAILHVIRYEAAVKKDPLELFKINNNFSSRYARKFIQEFPEHKGFFEIRVLRPL